VDGQWSIHRECHIDLRHDGTVTRQAYTSNGSKR